MQDVELNIIKGCKDIVSSMGDEAVHRRLTSVFKELDGYPDCAPKAFMEEAKSYCSQRSLLQFIMASSVLNRTQEDYVPRLFTSILRDLDGQPAFAPICNALIQKEADAPAPAEVMQDNIEKHSRRAVLKRMASFACLAAVPLEFADTQMATKTTKQKAGKMARVGAEAGIGSALAIAALDDSTQANTHRAIHLLDVLIQNRMESVRGL